MKITGTKSKYEVGDVVVAEFGNKECIVKIKSVSVMVDDLYLVDFLEFPIKDIEVMLYHYDILGLAEITDNEPKKLVTKDRYEVGDVILIPMVVGSLDIRGDNKIKGYFGESGGYCHHLEVLGLFSDNEPKDNDGWIMVSDYEPLVKTNIFFVTTNGEIHLGYRSALDYQYNNHFDSTTYMREQVIKWKYVKFPKI